MFEDEVENEYEDVLDLMREHGIEYTIGDGGLYEHE